MNIDIKAPQYLKQKTISKMEVHLHKKAIKKPLKFALIAVFITVILSLTAFTFNIFSGLVGDELALSSKYLENGIVEITIENRSEKTLHMKDEIKIMQWTTAKEILPINNGKKLELDMPKIKPNETEIIKIDLNETFDIELLETPLVNDNYYFILTNNNFLHGHDWHCTVFFSEPIREELPEPIAPEIDETKLEGMVEGVFEDFSGNIVRPIRNEKVIPTTEYEEIQPFFDDSLPAEDQQFHWLFSNSYYIGDFSEYGAKLPYCKGDCFSIISASVPDKTHPGQSYLLSLFHLATYEKEDFNENDNYALIMGEFVNFNDLEAKILYEDDVYVIYDITSYFYTDLDKYIEDYFNGHPDSVYNEEVDLHIRHIHQYFSDNFKDLFHYLPFED